jgi:hypothetical protein
MIDIPYLDISIEGFMNEQMRIHKEFTNIRVENYCIRKKLYQSKLRVII